MSITDLCESKAFLRLLPRAYLIGTIFDISGKNIPSDSPY